MGKHHHNVVDLSIILKQDIFGGYQIRMIDIDQGLGPLQTMGTVFPTYCLPYAMMKAIDIKNANWPKQVKYDIKIKDFPGKRYSTLDYNYCYVCGVAHAPDK